MSNVHKLEHFHTLMNIGFELKAPSHNVRSSDRTKHTVLARLAWITRMVHTTHQDKLSDDQCALQISTWSTSTASANQEQILAAQYVTVASAVAQTETVICRSVTLTRHRNMGAQLTNMLSNQIKSLKCFNFHPIDGCIPRR